jgi:hypothetical protein
MDPHIMRGYPRKTRSVAKDPTEKLKIAFRGEDLVKQRTPG